MHTETTTVRAHDHIFDSGNAVAERSARAVTWITVVMMVVEIIAGWQLNSMALLADGWHMSSHAVAIGLSAIAYASARRYANDRRFAFGAWKIEILAGFASALFLLGVAVMMLAGSVERIIAPQPIKYREAVAIAVVGLVVNIICAHILGKTRQHTHHHSHDHVPGHYVGHDDDLNLKAAYLHVVADAATSILAIIALFGGWIYGWSWLDPVTGIVGAVLVAVWAWGIIVDAGKVLLDREMDHPVVNDVRCAVEKNGLRIADLHVWRVGRKAFSCAMTVVSRDMALTPDMVRAFLSEHKEIVHSTIEIQHLSVAPDGQPEPVLERTGRDSP